MTAAMTGCLLARPASTQLDLLHHGWLSPGELLDAHLERIETENPRLNAIVTLVDEATLRAAAREAERDIVAGRAQTLTGLPFTVKDSIATAGLRATCGTKLLADQVPAADATAVARLRAAGAILLGKTNCSEFALAMHTDNPLFGPTANPVAAGVTPGGSSGGEAAAVAAGLSPLGLGTDYGTSVRWPAHCAGIAALRPTVGRVPGTGQLPAPRDAPQAIPNSLRLQGQLQVIGPLARSVADLELALVVMAGADGCDALAADVDLGRSRNVDVRRLRVAWWDGDEHHPVRDDVASVVRAASRALANEGLDVVHDLPPGLHRADELFMHLRRMDGLADVRAVAEGREHLLGAAMRELLAGDDSATVADLQRANVERDAVRAGVVAYLRERPVLLWPVAATPAVDPSDEPYDVAGRKLRLGELGAWCRVVSLLGLPAVSVPFGISREGLPVGVQVVGSPFGEAEVLAVGRLLERVAAGGAA